jgi:hypothetical protein
VKFFTPLGLKNDDTLVTRLTEIFRDIAAALTDLVVTGSAAINRINSVPNESYDLYTNTAAIAQWYHGTLASTVTLNNFVYSVRPTVTLSGTGTFRAYDFDVTIAGSGASSAAYGTIGAVTIAGAGSAKGVYGRSVASSGFTGTVVGLVGGSQFNLTTANAWALQLDVTGADTTNLPTALATGILVGSNNAGTRTHFGLYFNDQLNYNNAVIRWNQRNASETAAFLEQLDSSSAVAHSVDSLGKLTYARKTALVGNGYPLFVASALESAKSATVSATTIFTATATGVYRVPVGISIKTAATTSSSVTVTVLATDPRDSVVKTYQLGTYSGNVVNEGQCFPGYVYAKIGTAVQYVLTYASSGATSMVYDAVIGCEWLG